MFVYRVRVLDVVMHPLLSNEGKQKRQSTTSKGSLEDPGVVRLLSQGRLEAPVASLLQVIQLLRTPRGQAKLSGSKRDTKS